MFPFDDVIMKTENVSSLEGPNNLSKQIYSNQIYEYGFLIFIIWGCQTFPLKMYSRFNRTLFLFVYINSTPKL